MARYQVVCIRKQGPNYAPHERITHVGVGNAWSPTILTQEDVIRRITSSSDSFYVSNGGRTVEVIVAYHNGRPYLKTQADGYEPNNLLSLPECM
jgi:hypothetical protein